MIIGHKKIPCPVCGYPLDFSPWNGNLPSDEICPCCGTQFGYHDFAGGELDKRPAKHSELRRRWIAAGMRWSDSLGKPPNWNPQKQLLDAGIKP